jgi:hypothetical protein
MLFVFLDYGYKGNQKSANRSLFRHIFFRPARKREDWKRLGVVEWQVTKKARMIILGDWITHFTYVVYDGEHLLMSQYIEGESRP